MMLNGWILSGGYFGDVSRFLNIYKASCMQGFYQSLPTAFLVGYVSRRIASFNCHRSETGLRASCGTIFAVRYQHQND